jgi:general secretion pathway protein A
MYASFFGFAERPFKLVPNPAYLFLSASHEEVLAHLAYAVSQGEGFLEITGEVGTGKTTICRTFLESLTAEMAVAYIFNPRLDALQLLRAINDEFGLPTQAENTRDLIDSLNRYLIDVNLNGKKAILLIDEAQNLNYEVLEQLRLLSNLETTTQKLLQIILVGQPELSRMLAEYRLRQIRQRITLRCALKPLTMAETKAYIQHRIQIAAAGEPCATFSAYAHGMIYKFAAGIPRLINIVCDRALLTAYVREEKHINRATISKAIKELGGRKTFNLDMKKSERLLGTR